MSARERVNEWIEAVMAAGVCLLMGFCLAVGLLEGLDRQVQIEQAQVARVVQS